MKTAAAALEFENAAKQDRIMELRKNRNRRSTFMNKDVLYIKMLKSTI